MNPRLPALALWMSLTLTLACGDHAAQAFHEARRDDRGFSDLSQITEQNVDGLQLQRTSNTLDAHTVAGQPSAFSPKTGLLYLPRQGELVAWDPVAGRPRWKLLEKSRGEDGALATAGDLVFYGTADGWLKAVSAETGTPLWQFKDASGSIGQPVTYLGPDGKQYVAARSGEGGLSVFALP